jgi:hypothetical protein
MDFFDNLARKREADIAELDQKYEAAIRNHLVQLFRAARLVEPGLEGVLFGMGGYAIKGTYICQGDPTSEFPEEREQTERDPVDWSSNVYDMYQPKHKATLEFFKALESYGEMAGSATDPLPLLGRDITLEDVNPRRIRKINRYGDPLA